MSVSQSIYHCDTITDVRFSRDNGNALIFTINTKGYQVGKVDFMLFGFSDKAAAILNTALCEIEALEELQ